MTVPFRRAFRVGVGLLACVASAQAAPAQKKEKAAAASVLHPRVTLVSPRFDGRELTGTLLVCAENGPAYVDQELPSSVRNVTDPQGAQLSFAVFDTLSTQAVAIREVEKSFCYGRAASYRLFAAPMPAYSGCLTVELSLLAFSKGGQANERITFLVNVCSP